ncbi:MAG TPA: hypothetical protein VNO81_07665 [Candidatus Nitrosotenuis sp.]|nr:hypothetical protein [Candidatus Nitrosotenuis sp.]
MTGILSPTAKEAAATDFLSGSRLEPGLGAGWFQGEQEMAGYAFDPPGCEWSA